MSSPFPDNPFRRAKWKPTYLSVLRTEAELVEQLKVFGEIFTIDPEAAANELYVLNHLAQVIFKLLNLRAEGGDTDAAGKLARLARSAADALYMLGEFHGATVAPAASYMERWPVCVTRDNFKDSKPKADKAVREHLKRIGFLRKGRGKQEGNPISELAFVFYRTVATIIADRRANPTTKFPHETDAVIQASFQLDPHFPISKANAGEWWRALSPIVHESPEDLHWLKVKGPIEDWPGLEKYWVHDDVTKLPPKSKRSKVRDLIMRAMAKAFQAIPQE